MYDLYACAAACLCVRTLNKLLVDSLALLTTTQTVVRTNYWLKFHPQVMPTQDIAALAPRLAAAREGMYCVHHAYVCVCVCVCV